METNNKQLVEVVKSRKGTPIGVIAAVVTPTNEISLGWSRAAKNKGDKFDKKLGIDIAVGRACRRSAVPVIPSLKDRYQHMENRAKRYFKQAVNSDCNPPF